MQHNNGQGRAANDIQTAIHGRATNQPLSALIQDRARLLLIKANKQTNKNLRCGNRKGLLGRNDQTHHTTKAHSSMQFTVCSELGFSNKRRASSQTPSLLILQKLTTFRQTLPLGQSKILSTTKWPHQSGAPVGAAPPTRSQHGHQWHKHLSQIKLACTVRQQMGLCRFKKGTVSRHVCSIQVPHPLSETKKTSCQGDS